METVWELFVHGLREMLNAENKLVHVLAEQAREVSREDLRHMFEEHRRQTEGHAGRLIDIFREIGEPPEQADCKGIDGLKEEKLTLLKQDPSRELLDFIDVGAGIKVERYEISAYEMLLQLAQELGAERSAHLLKQNLNEEQEAFNKLQDFVPGVRPTNLGIKENPEGGIPRKAA